MKLKIKKIPKVFIMFLIAVSIAGIFYNTIIFLNSRKFVSDEEIVIVIPEGATAKDIGEMLEEEEVIASSKRFTVFAKMAGKEKNIKAGRYIFHKGMGIRNVLQKLVKGETSALLVTIPEGLTMDGISIILEKELKIDREKFLKLANDKKFAARMGISGKNFEGFLFPNTYEFNHGITEKEVIERLLKEFWKVFNDSAKKRAKKIGFTVCEIVTLASLIEEEAMIDSEHPIISQVYHKRLQLNRALECDATIQYALPKHKSRLLYKDLKIESPYNTYLHKGLPPGPIASPGKSSIIAALYPADTDYLYYVAKGDGSHIFSKTAKGHYKAIESLRRNKK
ncbi:endolytic transglycosylase MltG [candidate division WOR-3 bacterium]|nr:endolytic transglycosylase MltG [candidate division WOR-3 bacterium]